MIPELRDAPDPERAERLTERVWAALEGPARTPEARRAAAARPV